MGVKVAGGPGKAGSELLLEASTVWATCPALSAAASLPSPAALALTLAPSHSEVNNVGGGERRVPSGGVAPW